MRPAAAASSSGQSDKHADGRIVLAVFPLRLEQNVLLFVVTQLCRDIRVDIEFFVEAVLRHGFNTPEFAIAIGAADRKSTRLNSSHSQQSRMPSSA